MIDVSQITSLQRTMVESWHAGEIQNPCRDLLHLIVEQHRFNFLLWHEEDVARSPDEGDSRIAAVKRAIDRYNQQRNDSTERIDEHLARLLEDRGIRAPADAPLNTETPGSAIDRLSILALRIYHMQEQADRADAAAEHVQRAREKLAILHAQREDLSTALATLCDDIAAGRKRLKIYRQFKMYNDPALNPYLYGGKGATG